MPFNILIVVRVKLSGGYFLPSRGLLAIIARFHTGLRILLFALCEARLSRFSRLFTVPFPLRKLSVLDYTLKVQNGSMTFSVSHLYSLEGSFPSEFFVHCASKPEGPIVYLEPSRRAVL